MNKKTIALTDEQYKNIISTMRTGFICTDGHVVKANNRIATALSLEANLGLRIGDILQLRLSSIIRDGDRYRLDIIEQKTKKKREFTVPTDIYIYIQNYALENNISPAAKLFDLSETKVDEKVVEAAMLKAVQTPSSSVRKAIVDNTIGQMNGVSRLGSNRYRV